MYSGVREELMPGQSPIDLFHKPLSENIQRFPLLKQTQVFDITLHPGNCIYVPAWWWMQSTALSQQEVNAHDQNASRPKPKNDDLRLLSNNSSDSINVQFDFEPHSQLFDIINTGIELDLILADENSQGAESRLE